MSFLSDITALVVERPDADSRYTKRDQYDLENTCEESVSGVQVIDASTGPIEISLGSVDKGKVLIFSADSALTLHINDSGVDSFTGTFAVIEFDDTTGLTSLHVTNDNSSAVTYEYSVVGDVSSS
jgi:hypothetical protein